MSLETEEDWMRCAEWMVRCGVVSAQLKNNLSSIEHLASIVKDGVLLCNLLNSLKPGCIKPNEFSSRPQASYVSLARVIHLFRDSFMYFQ